MPSVLQSTFSSESNILSCLCWSHVLSNDDGGTKFFNSTGRHLFVPLQHSLTIYVTKTWAQPIVVVQVALKGKQLQSKYKNRRSSWFVTTRPLSLKISLIFQSLGRNDKNDYLLPTEFIDSLKGRIQRWQPFPPPPSSPHPCPPPPPHHRHLRHLLFLQPQEQGTPLGP